MAKYNYNINFFYRYKWEASNFEGDWPIPNDIIDKLEEIRIKNWPDVKGLNFKNISFDIYWFNDEYSGIHNYRINGEQIQNRYEGYLEL
jgi:hypothetical protein